ncbi:xylulokinase [Paenibacillus nasutitermitis]|uniref:Xylulokinase n=1 Tax=Paenibacillus nasutitermitis TaxID=1652958 RepID=A0A916ZBQ1_9BACL|nr:FGGY family carbohydrate kinase [Paenibacillus nasutitermitis]GGD86980.1 xylulokinase [Paenibacillus nasutitermitis]
MSIYVGVDIGTSGVRAVAFSDRGETIAEGRCALHTEYSEGAQAQQRPTEWLDGAVAAMRALADQLGERIGSVRAIGLTGQCPSFTLLRPDGQLFHTGYIYQDNRAIRESELLIDTFGAAEIHRRTGEAPSPFYVLPKLLWLLEHDPESLAPGSAILQPRDAVGWHLTGTIATDPTHAACTLAFDIHAGEWAWDWLERLGLKELHWPNIVPSCESLGMLTAEAAAATGFPAGIPVVNGAADSLCAVYGAQAAEAGVLFDVSGTSTCLHMAIPHPVSDYAINTYPHVEEGAWIAEVGINTTGAALNWVAGLFGRTHRQLLDEASGIPAGADNLLFLPHLAGGERDDPGRPGAFVGLHMGHTPGHLARAVLEGVALALRQRITLLERSGYPVHTVVVSGGGARSGLWNQIKSDVFGLRLSALAEPDSTALGAAMTAYRYRNSEPMRVAGNRIEYNPDLSKQTIYASHFARFCELEERLKP